VNVATVEVCPDDSRIFTAMPTTSELFVPVVNAGMTEVVVCAERSDEATVPSSVVVVPVQARICAPDESPLVPVVSPVQVIVGLSVAVPSAIRVNT